MARFDVRRLRTPPYCRFRRWKYTYAASAEWLAVISKRCRSTSHASETSEDIVRLHGKRIKRTRWLSLRSDLTDIQTVAGNQEVLRSGLSPMAGSTLEISSGVEAVDADGPSSAGPSSVEGAPWAVASAALSPLSSASLAASLAS